MSRLRDDDESALDALVAAYWRPVVHYAEGLLGDRDAAYDVAQEAFVRLWQRRRMWDNRGSARVWLFRTVRNLSISEQRKREVRVRSAASVRAFAAPPPTPLEEAENRELRAAIHAALEGLSDRRREAFTLFHLHHLSHREIADIMGVRPQTVANYLHAALAELRVSLRQFFPALSPHGSDAPNEGRARDPSES